MPAQHKLNEIRAKSTTSLSVLVKPANLLLGSTRWSIDAAGIVWRRRKAAPKSHALNMSFYTFITYFYISFLAPYVGWYSRL